MILTSLKNSKVNMRDDTEALIDSGYTGLDKTHRNTDLLLNGEVTESGITTEVSWFH